MHGHGFADVYVHSALYDVTGCIAGALSGDVDAALGARATHVVLGLLVLCRTASLLPSLLCGHMKREVLRG